MGLFYTFKADGEEKLLSTYVADPSDRYALQWLYEDFRLVDRQPFPMLMDVQVLKNGNPEGGVKIHYSRIPVSYTHLDVYKRQLSSNVMRPCSVPWRRLSIYNGTFS